MLYEIQKLSKELNSQFLVAWEIHSEHEEKPLHQESSVALDEVIQKDSGNFKLHLDKTTTNQVYRYQQSYSKCDVG